MTSSNIVAAVVPELPPQAVAGIASHFVPVGTFGPVFYTDAIKFKKVDFGAIDKKPTDEIAKDAEFFSFGTNDLTDRKSVV